ncbi:2OG-Fe(II) oxygenase [Alteromonas lipotrueiana]|uniref:2OG-Fe(II) oxygenase n=1 Tax=Alteromonas lipotrueiana TaxID=2803815 RepID=UPI001C44C0A1|nr:2OG-Fe(II) oxygenase [Alteromonas lipotrueiana]
MAKVTNKPLFSFKGVALNLVTYPTGHQVLRHHDPMGSGRYYKLNIVIKKPEAGGEFSADKVIFSWLKRIYLFRPDLYSHSVSRIEKGQRKLLSLAVYIP